MFIWTLYQNLVVLCRAMEHKSSGRSHKTFTYPGGQNVALIFIDQYFSRKYHQPTNSWYISIIPFSDLKVKCMFQKYVILAHLNFTSAKDLWMFSSEGDPPLVRSFQWCLDRTQNARGRWFTLLSCIIFYFHSSVCKQTLFTYLTKYIIMIFWLKETHTWNGK